MSVVAECAALAEKTLTHIVIEDIHHNSAAVGSERSGAAKHDAEQALRRPLLVERHPVPQRGQAGQQARRGVRHGDDAGDGSNLAPQERPRQHRSESVPSSVVSESTVTTTSVVAASKPTRCAHRFPTLLVSRSTVHPGNCAYCA
jgi:hypothetical protein